MMDIKVCKDKPVSRLVHWENFIYFGSRTVHKEDIVKTGKEKTRNEVKPVEKKNKNPLSFLYKFPKLQDHAYEHLPHKVFRPMA